MSSTVQKIKERLSIVEIISNYITLEKAGGSLKAKCPFHMEKSPSFFVSPERNAYYCFGCGAKGDIFTFVQEFEGLDFYGALKMLADRAGVKIEGKDEESPKKRLFEIMEEATRFFQKNLSSNKDALVYLKSRNLDIKIVNEWRIGFALDDWRALKNHLLNLRFKEEEIEEAGLIKSGTDGGQSYDRFRNRIIFPIFDTSARVVAFSGRTMSSDPNEAKYLNSPDTPLFDKSRILFGLHKAKTHIREKGCVVLVEGQVDLLMAHQAGTDNAVASSGTAITEFHLSQLRRMTDTLIVAYDADSAGQEASFRAWKIALSLGFEVKMPIMPEGEDPASLISKDKEQWLKIIEKAESVIDYYVDLCSKKENEKNRLKIIKEKILPLIKSIENSIDQSNKVQKISFATGIKESAIWEELSKIKDSENNAKTERVFEAQNNLPLILKRAVSFLLFLKEGDGETASDYLNKLTEIKKDINDLIPKNSDEITRLIFEAKMNYEGIEKGQVINELLFHVEEEELKKQFSASMELMKKAEAVHDTKVVEDELRRCQSLSDKISKLSNKYFKK